MAYLGWSKFWFPLTHRASSLNSLRPVQFLTPKMPVKNQHQLASPGENRRILLLVALFFGVVFPAQYLELPYGSGFFPSFYAVKTRVSFMGCFSAGNSSSKFSSNSFTSADHLYETTNAFKFPDDDKDAVGTQGVGSGSDSKDESPSFDFIKVNSRRSPIVFVGRNASSVYKDARHTIRKPENNGVVLKRNLTPSLSSKKRRRTVKKKFKGSEGVVVSLSQMNYMFISNLTSYRAKKPKWTSESDQQLLVAKTLVESSPAVHNDPGLHAPLFRNFSMFKRSYELMEQTLKVYMYTEGERPIFHSPLLRGIYASEGWFMKQLIESKDFVTENPKNAHLFYLPFSSWMLREMLYVPNSHKRRNLVRHLNNYIGLISSRSPFWNRTGGADHFLVACHDWAPAETKQVMANCIRALCNSDITKGGFQFGKDVSLAETFVRSDKNPLEKLRGQPPKERKILAFFAGRMNGYLRPILLQHWLDKDPDMKIFGQMPVQGAKGQMSYIDHMKNSKYCICAKGYEVNSPRVVEAISYECVPVIISDNFVPPFFETLNWESFAVFVAEKDIPNLKNILVSIPEDKYLKMQRNVKLVKQHFLWHSKPVKYDIFHMILHSIWHTRISQLGSS